MSRSKQELRVLALISDYKATFSTPEGKRVLRSLMKKTGFLDTNYVQGIPGATEFNEGARSIVIHILHQIKMNLSMIEKQLSEEYEDDN